ncbi:MarR family winged helix-turn-helix transcriptional regulator [Clostridium magnum]|uniref:Multidrug resistance operon repressor n=1 Tax=Clostridium magnum DSM 2767 TaxID=1121326 RepID=A0A161Y3I5_9CLOT|nr:MarR family transcriptional regulator [Clostridium magnum]KZL92609.1 multidrug resistance operon repressor [Clostridium magnum DSM 2767]SHJ06733.1 DNA-binding transcriptional regulator, MarR family [Clostridium magnum DSM 2767]
MDNNVRILLKLTNGIYRCTQVYIDKKLGKFDLSIGTYPYLLVLNKNQGISQNEISRELSVDKAMSARTIKKLIELGYIRKEENEEDIRAYKLYITDKAKSIMPELIEILNEWTDILVQGNDKERIESSLEFLENVLENGKKYKRECCERMKSIEQERK